MTLAKLNWDMIYTESYGFDFIENMKSDLIKACDNPDYVFIDSRTGLSDTGNICTLQIPDIVVLLFSLNEQNREGIEKVYKAIKEFKNPEKPDKIIDVIPVASPVPYGEAGMKSRCLSEFSEIFKDKERILVLPYHPRLAFKETLILENEMKEEDIAYRLSELAREIKRLNPMDTEKYKEEVNRLFQTGEIDKALSLQQRIVEIEENDAQPRNLLGILYFFLQKYDEAIREFDKAIEIKPNNPNFFYNKANALCKINHFKEALPLYDKAIEINPKDSDFFYNKAHALCDLNRYMEALSLYNKVIEIKPDDASAHFNKACVLSVMGREEESIEFLKKAIELDASYKEKAKTDEDFKSLLNLPSFKKLVGLE